MLAYDVLVLGAGSGGVAFAKRCAAHGAKVAIVERAAFGGTCVNVGCVPKKIMWWATQVRGFLHEAHQYGFHTDAAARPKLDWAYLKQRRDASVQRLNGIYEKQLRDSNVDVHVGAASFASFDDSGKPAMRDGAWCIAVAKGDSEVKLRATHVLIATGSKSVKLGIPGEAEVAVGSDGFFDLEKLPERVAIVGAGYIAVEFAGMLQELGACVDLFIRGECVLRKFDELISKHVTANLEKQGVTIHRETQPRRFIAEGGKFVETDKGEKLGPFDSVIVAVGREPNTDGLRLDECTPAIVRNKTNGAIVVDEYQNTSAFHVYAVGDVISKVELTPMAIAAGRRLADRLFLAGYESAKVSYENVPSVIFSHPPVGSVGLSEKEARERYHAVLIYTNTAVNLYYNVFDVAPETKPRTYIKVVCSLDDEGEEVVRGIHIVGMGADEIIQGFGFAVGIPKTKLDSVVAVHPSAAEEIVTCQPWGLPHPDNTFKRPLTLKPSESPVEGSLAQKTTAGVDD